MSPETETLRLQLEEVGARHWWAALLATLSSQSGNATFGSSASSTAEHVIAVPPSPSPDYGERYPHRTSGHPGWTTASPKYNTASKGTDGARSTTERSRGK